MHDRKNFGIVGIVFYLIGVAEILCWDIKNVLSTSFRTNLHDIDIIRILHKIFGNQIEDDKLKEEYCQNQDKESRIVPCSKKSCNNKTNLLNESIVQAVYPRVEWRTIRVENSGDSKHPNSKHEVKYNCIGKESWNFEV